MMKINEEFLDTILGRVNKEGPNNSPSSLISARTVMKLAARGPSPPPFHNHSVHSAPTRFDLLYAENGFQSAKKWFLLNATNLDNTFSENQFINFLRKIANFSDHIILDVFDIFGK